MIVPQASQSQSFTSLQIPVALVNPSDRPIVHRAGGMLLQSKKEFVLCADLQPRDVFFYYTTTLAEVT